jgi:hypothetical protein
VYCGSFDCVSMEAFAAIAIGKGDMGFGCYASVRDCSAERTNSQYSVVKYVSVSVWET